VKPWGMLLCVMCGSFAASNNARDASSASTQPIYLRDGLAEVRRATVAEAETIYAACLA
jgi:hypothetical protein